MDRMRGFLLLTLLALVGPAAVQAQGVQYVTDSLPLEARTGPSTSHKIVRMLESGTRVTVLEESEGYSRIRTPDGQEVWILSRYLQSSPAAKDRLADAMRELKSLREEKASLSEKLTQARDLGQRTEGALAGARRDTQALSQELASIKQAAASTLATRAANERLTAEVGALKEQLDVLGAETRSLKESREREWFIAGAGVLGVGMLVGLVLPRLGRRRRRSFSQF